MNAEFNKKFEKILETIDVNATAPTEEPMRQYYYIKKCREIVKKKSEEIGRPLTSVAVTFGCQMNAGTKMMKVAC